jgi:hypothetical protein
MEQSCERHQKVINEYIKMIDERKLQFYKNYYNPQEESKNLTISELEENECNMSISDSDDSPNFENSILDLAPMKMSLKSGIEQKISRKSSATSNKFRSFSMNQVLNNS